MPNFQNGRGLRISIGGVAIIGATSCSLNVSADTLETATKDSTGNWKNFTPAGLSATLTHSGLLSTGGADISPHWAALIAGTVFMWEFTDGVSGTNKWSGAGFFTGMSIEAPDLQNSTIELPIQITGEIIHAVEA